jgi:hypothetical protein
MNRRSFLASAVLGTGAVAGCTGRNPVSGTDTATPTRTVTETSTGDSGTQELPIPKSDLNRGAAKDAIPAITEPAFGSDWSDHGGLTDEDVVVGVERGGQARAYPLRVLNWHEIVNDSLDGPLLVTYCPLCGSAVTAERTVRGEETNFGVSGYLYQSDLVMYDDLTDSLWSQTMSTAFNGPQTGETVTLVPSSLTTWSQWTQAYPDTEVLLPPPESDTVSGKTSRDYSRDPYAGYDRSERVGIGYNSYDDERLHPKAQVLGITHDGVSKAYPLGVVRKADVRVVNDEVNGLPVVVSVTAADTLVAYERTVDGQTLTFEADGADHLSAGDTRWERATGRAVEGALQGTRLTQANDRSPMFWFAWLDFHPETTLYQNG